MKIVTICGSMKFQKEMIEIARNLEVKRGYCVIQCVYDFKGKDLSQEEHAKIVDAHWKKIDLCDMIYVVNVGGYIGNSTRKEIEYAQTLGKEVEYLESIR